MGSRSWRTTRCDGSAATPATCSPASAGRGDAHDPALRPPGHRRGDGADRAGRRRRRLGRTRHDAILGADNKAAVAVILELARRVARRGLAGRRSSCCSPSARRTRSRAPRRFDARQLHSRVRLRLRPRDADRRGRSSASPTYYRLERRVPRPRRARRHPPGGRPHRDRSPPPRAIAAMPLGRIDDADDRERRLDRGRRRLDERRPRALLGPRRGRSLDRDARRDGRRRDGRRPPRRARTTRPPSATSTSTSRSCSTATATGRSAPSVVAAEAALRACGYEPARIVTGGGSDANALRGRAACPCIEPRQRHRAQPRARRARVASRRSRGCSTSPRAARRRRGAAAVARTVGASGLQHGGPTAPVGELPVHGTRTLPGRPCFAARCR